MTLTHQQFDSTPRSVFANTGLQFSKQIQVRDHFVVLVVVTVVAVFVTVVFGAIVSVVVAAVDVVVVVATFVLLSICSLFS